MNVQIAGAGIAGLSAALFLARDGHKVTLVERQRGTIDRVCGEGILPFGAAILDELGLHAQVASAGYRFRGVRYACEAAFAEGNFANGVHGIGIERGRLDQILRARAQAMGVEIHEGHNLEPDQVRSDMRILAADGIHSRWSSQAGMRRSNSKRLGLRFRIHAVPPDRVQVYFFRGFEVYLTPVGSESLSVAFLLDPQRIKLPGAALRDHCVSQFKRAFPHYGEALPQDLAMRGPIASTPSNTTPSLHLLGDAAQAFDPISGAGMSFALTCARLAARHIDDPAEYWRALAPHRRAVAAFTNLVLLLRGGGLRSRLMVRQLSRSQDCFDRILALHDGRSSPWALGPRAALSLLRP